MFTRHGFLVLLLLISLVLPLIAAELHPGKILSVGTDSITILDDRDGEEEKVTVTPQTKITRNGKPAKLSDLAVGDKAKIDATESRGKLTAKTIEAFMAE